MIRCSGSMKKIILFLSLCLLSSIPLAGPNSKNIMAEPDINLLPAAFNNVNFPWITISAINCNSLNMATVTKHVRLRKFYGICSLKTDFIFVSDIRMCNRSGLTDLKFKNETFAVNPHCAYNFFPMSFTNSRGVRVLVKKSLNFVCLDTERDLLTDSFTLLHASLQNHTVIIGSIYGPNRRDDDFYNLLCTSLSRLGVCVSQCVCVPPRDNTPPSG
jgi:hypothetical protein